MAVNLAVLDICVGTRSEWRVQDVGEEDTWIRYGMLRNGLDTSCSDAVRCTETMTPKLSLRLPCLASVGSLTPVTCEMAVKGTDCVCTD